MTRRSLLAFFGLLLAKPLTVLAAWNEQAFGAKTAADALKNPFPLAGKFDFKENALPFVKLNVKMGETSDVRVVAVAGGRQFVATREIKVTIGGCGG